MRMSKAIREQRSIAPIHTRAESAPDALSEAVDASARCSWGTRQRRYAKQLPRGAGGEYGTRQWGRERGPNVIDVPHEALEIRQAIERQIAHGRYPSSALYGTGDAGERIAEVLTRVCDRADTSQVG
jgi:hypothetical protein